MAPVCGPQRVECVVLLAPLVPQALFVGGCSALATAARVAAAVSRGGAAAIGTSGARSASDVEFCFGGALRANSASQRRSGHSAGVRQRYQFLKRVSVPRARLSDLPSRCPLRSAAAYRTAIFGRERCWRL